MLTEINFRNWRAEPWQGPKKGEKWQSAAIGIVDPEKAALPILGIDNPGMTFMYLYRRFGPQQFGSDDYKEIAIWKLTTPNPNVALWISPRTYEVTYGYCINLNWFGDDCWNKPKRAEVEYLLSLTMLDLLRPVWVRDTYFNARGDRDHMQQPYRALKAADRFKWAGYGVSHKYFEKEFGTDYDTVDP